MTELFRNFFSVDDAPRNIENKVFLVFIFIAAFFRFYNIEFQSPWLDEILTLYETDPSLNFSELFYRITKKAIHPPVYLTTLHYLYQIFGFSISFTRYFSAFFSVVCGYFLFRYSHKALGVNSSFPILLLLFVNLSFYWFSIEGRSYVFFISLLVISHFISFRYSDNQSVWNLIGLFFINLLIIYTNYYGVFFIFSQGLINIFYYHKNDRRIFKTFFLKYFLLALLFIPWIPFTSEGVNIKGFILEPPVLSEIWRPAFNSLFPNFLLKCLVLIFYLAGSIVCFRHNRFVFYQLTGWLYGLILFPYVFSHLVSPVMGWKYFIFILVPLIVFVGLGLSSVRYFYLRICLYFALFGISFYLVFWKFSSNYYPVKAEFKPFMDFIVDTGNDLPVVVNEVTANTYYNEFNNFNLNLVPFDALLSNDSLKSLLMSQGWWELHTHRPFFLASVDKRLSDSSFYRMDYNNFSTLSLVLPKKLLIFPDNISFSASGDLVMKFPSVYHTSGKAQFVFSLKSELPFYSTNKIRLRLNDQFRSFRLSNRNGIYFANFDLPKDAFSIIFSDFEKEKPALKKITLVDFMLRKVD